MSKTFILLPTFDGQRKGYAAVNPDAIDMIRPAVMPGMTNVYINGDQTTNCLGVFMEIDSVLAALRENGFNFINLAGDIVNQKSSGPTDDGM